MYQEFSEQFWLDLCPVSAPPSPSCLSSVCVEGSWWRHWGRCREWRRPGDAKRRRGRAEAGRRLRGWCGESRSPGWGWGWRDRERWRPGRPGPAGGPGSPGGWSALWSTSVGTRGRSPPAPARSIRTWPSVRCSCKGKLLKQFMLHFYLVLPWQCCWQSFAVEAEDVDEARHGEGRVQRDQAVAGGQPVLGPGTGGDWGQDDGEAGDGHLVQAQHWQPLRPPPERLLQQPGQGDQHEEGPEGEGRAALKRLPVRVLETQQDVWHVQSHRHLHSITSYLKLSSGRRLLTTIRWFLCPHWSAGPDWAVIGPRLCRVSTGDPGAESSCKWCG